MLPRVSFIIPTYYRENPIREIYTNRECIVVHDGSIDNTVIQII